MSDRAWHLWAFAVLAAFCCAGFGKLNGWQITEHHPTYRTPVESSGESVPYDDFNPMDPANIWTRPDDPRSWIWYRAIYTSD